MNLKTSPFFEHRDFVALRDALPDYLKPMVTFGYKTGWRSKEITGLNWGSVDLNNGIVTLKVGETKNDEARTVYLDDELKSLLTDLWEKRKKQDNPPPYVFTNKSGSGPVVNIVKSWNNACRKVGIGYGYSLSMEYTKKWGETLEPGPIFHDLRRTAVRNMIRSSIPARVAMMLSGHKTRDVCDRCNIVSDSDLKQAARQQQAYFESQTGSVLGTVG